MGIERLLDGFRFGMAIGERIVCFAVVAVVADITDVVAGGRSFKGGFRRRDGEHSRIGDRAGFSAAPDGAAVADAVGRAVRLDRLAAGARGVVDQRGFLGVFRQEDLMRRSDRPAHLHQLNAGQRGDFLARHEDCVGGVGHVFRLGVEGWFAREPTAVAALGVIADHHARAGEGFVFKRFDGVDPVGDDRAPMDVAVAAAGTVFVVVGTGQEIVVHGGVVHQRKTVLAHVAEAAGALSGFPRLAESGEQHRGEDRDDGDYDEQFNEREISLPGGPGGRPR
ncbi:hypothetical protein SDC9_144692 [bioreactor metagenome]|uniref:Uncharacterized protein n=1 Tax=bioreactor metagenome TaxID=1076179 RepID=A0A645E7W4_9ZZZZ